MKIRSPAGRRGIGKKRRVVCDTELYRARRQHGMVRLGRAPTTRQRRSHNTQSFRVLRNSLAV